MKQISLSQRNFCFHELCFVMQRIIGILERENASMRKLPTLINHDRSFQMMYKRLGNAKSQNYSLLPIVFLSKTIRWIIGNWKRSLSFRTRKLKIALSYVYHDSFEQPRFHRVRWYSLPENMEHLSKKQFAELLDK